MNLAPGGWTITSSAQLAYLGGGHYAVGNISNSLLYNGNSASLIEDAIGGSSNDTIAGNVADNHLTGGGGNDNLDSGAGTDTAMYLGMSTDYQWLQNANGIWTVTDLRAGSADGIDTLTNIEFLKFLDTVVQIGTPPLVLANSAPVFTSTAQAATLTEWADLSADETANTPHTASGTITFTDADTTDTHSASATAKGTGFLGKFTLNTSTIDSNDSFSWSFSVADKAIDYLTAGQTLTQSYDVKLDDGHGGTAFQTVTITIVGTADATTKVAHGGGESGKGAAPASGADSVDGQNDLSSNGTDHLITQDQSPAPATDVFVFKPFVTTQQSIALPNDAAAIEHAKALDAVVSPTEVSYVTAHSVLDVTHHNDWLLN